MSLLSRREIRNQLFVLVGAASVALAATTALVKPSSAPSTAAAQATDVAAAANTTVNWDDINLSGSGPSPEDEVSTARSKMLGDFEAR